MWRHITGVKRPSETERRETAGSETGNVNVVEAKKKYCSFNEKWRISRDWLVYDNNVMFCQDCRLYTSDKSKTNSFVVGTNNMKIEAVKDHESSKSHVQAQATKKGS